MEYWDICDATGKPTGCIWPKGEPFPLGMYHLAAEIWVVNKNGEILIQRRGRRGARSSPGLGPDHGEDSRWGVHPPRGGAGTVGGTGHCRQPEELVPLLRARRTELIWDVYLLRRDTPLSALRLQEEEVAEARWVTPDIFRQMAATGELYRYPELEDVLGRVKELCR